MARLTCVCVSELEKNYCGAIRHGDNVKQALSDDDFNAPVVFHMQENETQNSKISIRFSNENGLSARARSTVHTVDIL